MILLLQPQTSENSWIPLFHSKNSSLREVDNYHHKIGWLSVWQKIAMEKGLSRHPKTLQDHFRRMLEDPKKFNIPDDEYKKFQNANPSIEPKSKKKHGLVK
ncbi:unnamed protein product [Allacma fusca]|uniref:Uncharacterized protein n=1 Tax=Allacma fusca TaxID=39272 RepID=A0A8J2KYL4_9HEXA|nr:unnamed protein product [Allacma fusca]